MEEEVLEYFIGKDYDLWVEMVKWAARQSKKLKLFGFTLSGFFGDFLFVLQQYNV